MSDTKFLGERVSAAALIAGNRALNSPPREADYVELRLLYDPFKPETVEVHEVDHQPGAKLSDYLKDLPDEAEWMVFFNGVEVENLDDAEGMEVKKGDRIGLIVMPLGSGGLKGVLRVVLQAAAVAVALLVPELSLVAAIAINVGVGLVNAFLLTPKPPKMSSEEDDRSYGIDGAKNSATEGIPYPVVYGQYRVAGNFSDTFTVNSGDDQFLYLRTILNDGEIESISDVEINEQPLENYTDIDVDYAMGTLDQNANAWFTRSTVQVNKSVKIDTDWISHITSSEVDKLRMDIVFTQGLVHITSKKGKYKNRSVTFEVEYRQLDPVTKEPVAGFDWANLPHRTPKAMDLAGGLWSLDVASDFILEVVANSQNAEVTNTSVEPKIQYRLVGDTEWTDLVVTTDKGKDFIYDQIGDGTISGDTKITPLVSMRFDLNLPAGTYEFQEVDGASITKATQYPNASASTATFVDSRTRQIRKSIESERLDRGFYEVRIRRTTPTSTDKYDIDEAYLSDVAEIDCDPVNLRGTANMSLRVRLNEQLSSIPTVTTLVKGTLLQEYDIDGNPTVKRWSANPAWIGLDILLSQHRGALMSPDRIDWPAWYDFAQCCEDNGIEFNGVFDTATNIGEALRTVLRIGHAAPIPLGTKVSVAIDRKRDPVMVFGAGNIVSGTFQMSYLSMADRANDFEVSYFDKNDRNKQKTIRYVDPKAVTFNEMPRKASVTFKGIDNVEQARIELWRMIYANRLLLRTATFDTTLESIGMSLGQVALLDHPMMVWGKSGRLGRGSTTTDVKLDQEVTLEAGKNYALLVHFDALELGTATVNSKVGNRLLVATSAISDDATKDKVHRVSVSGDQDNDYAVVRVDKGPTFDTIYLDSPPAAISPSDTISFWQTDAVEEFDVSSATTGADGTSTIQVASPLPAVPKDLANFVFGEKTVVKRPFTLTGIAGQGIERRTLTFVEYHEGVYADPEIEIPIPTTRVSDKQVAQVTKLLLEHEYVVSSDRTVVNATLHWDSSDVIDYGGADVYIALNGAPFTLVGSAPSTNEMSFQLAPEDEAVFRVVAYNTHGYRAPRLDAPLVSVNVVVDYAELDAPTDFVASQHAFEVDATASFTWTPPADTDGIDMYEVNYKRSVDSEWISGGTFKSSPANVAGLQTGTWDARVRALGKNSISLWVETQFDVVVAPGSLMANFEAGNDRNGSAIAAPTLPVAEPIQHTINTDGSADINIDWLWDGDEATIDGFSITISSA